MKKSILVLFTAVILLYGLALYSGFLTLIIPLSKHQKQNHHLVKGEKINPLNSLNFDSGKWEVYLSISPNDFDDLPPSIIHAAALKTTDQALIKNIQKTWHFTYTGSDIATVTSSIYFVKDGALVFASGIVLSKQTEGLQSEEYGWMVPDDKNALSDFGKHLKPIYWPIVFLNY